MHHAIMRIINWSLTERYKLKLDYSLKTPEERIAYVNSFLTENSSENIKKQYLTYMSDYILFVADKDQTKKEYKEDKPIVTKNREVTVSKRQVSLEEIVSTLENGEDGLYARITNDKNQIMDKKDKITDEDAENVPGLRENLELIEKLKRQFEVATGQKKYSLKRQIIETWQQIYILKASATGGSARSKATNQIKNMAHANLKEHIYLDKNDMPHSDGLITLFNPAHISFLLCYYSQLKQECADDLMSDMHFLLLDLENLVMQTLRDEPILLDLVVWKIDGKTNEEIQKLMESRYGIQHNEQYFSTLWRKRIPKMLAEQASKNWLVWYYTNEEYGSWKKCGRCGEIKLAHPLFFSRNTSEDGFYSICKTCRKKK